MLALADRQGALRARRQAWTERSLPEHLAWAEAQFPDRPMVIADGQGYTYRDVLGRARRVAAGLRGHGVQAGDRVAVMLPNGIDFVVSAMGVLLAGAVLVPLSYLYRERELEYALRQSGALLAVLPTGFKGIDDARMASAVIDRMASIDPAAEVPRIIQVEVDAPLVSGVQTLENLIASADTQAASARPDIDPHAVAIILYTSGTTGDPKGVCLTHDNLLRTAYSAVWSRGFQDGRRIAFALPLHHIFALNEGLVASTFVGGAIAPQQAFDARELLDLLRDTQANDLLCVPTMAQALIEEAGDRRPALPSLEATYCAASPAPAWLWKQLADLLDIAELVTGYGMTETGGSLTMTRPGDDVDRLVKTVGVVKAADVAGLDEHGRPVARLAIRDPETGIHLPAGQSGEICWQGPAVTCGFWESPVDTDRSFDDGWLRTGDLGHLDNDGYLALTGRIKEIYKSGGEVVIPAEVERFLVDLPTISDAFVVGIPDEKWGEIGCAFVVAESGTVIDVDQVREACRRGLARFKVPKRVLAIAADELPKTATGKIQKFRLIQLASAKAAQGHVTEDTP
jgi:fatty-acyl-CoA synthase